MVYLPKLMNSVQHLYEHHQMDTIYHQIAVALCFNKTDILVL